MAVAAQVNEFNYGQLDASTADFLRKKETNMREIVGKAYTDLGRELKEAQDALASHDKYRGVFEKWYTSLGWSKEPVYRLIRRYELVTNCDEVQRGFNFRTRPTAFVSTFGPFALSLRFPRCAFTACIKLGTQRNARRSAEISTSGKTRDINGLTRKVCSRRLKEECSRENKNLVVISLQGTSYVIFTCFYAF
ncbi:hypothetical protein [Paenibacillus hamazuiensis]|uniref:hypothetical protein n=1 Tax=Paenibacillus hamazuiensis TaxID=2936508 RepID=UPI00200D4270|nr:hypothetical protein [Paenibacillus hamazuiensis]